MASLRQAREPRIEDLLGRTPVPIDLDTVRRSLAGRRVLVTGAGGSIGSEICRQVAELDPALLVLLDHDETHLHDTAATVHGPCEQALVDITDRSAVFEVFERFRPEVVFHAAAHKHVPVLEHHPVEAAQTNVFGTLNVVEAAVDGGHPALRADLHRQGRPPLERHGCLQAPGRAGRAVPRPDRRLLLHGPVRERARQPGQRDPDLRPPDRQRRPGHGHRCPDDPVLHERRGGGPAGPASRRCCPTAAGRSSCSRWASRSGSSIWPSG